jgi:hypothetical protein
MTRTDKCMLAIMAACALCLTGEAARATAVTWTINSAASSVKLSIPDSIIQSNRIGFRNQTGSGSSWTTNIASVSGTLATDYIEGGSLDFVSGSSIVALNSGNYRPNPAAFNPSATDTNNPDGIYTNAATAAGVFGGKLVALDLSSAAFAYLAFRNVNLAIDSSVMPFVGNTFNTAAGLSFGIASAGLDIDGVGVILPENIIPDARNTPVSSIAANANPNGTLADLGGLNRRITIPINVPLLINFEGSTLNATLTGQIVANAVVPEPSTLMMAGIGLLSLAFRAPRRSWWRATRHDQRFTSL